MRRPCMQGKSEAGGRAVGASGEEAGAGARESVRVPDAALCKRQSGGRGWSSNIDAGELSDLKHSSVGARQGCQERGPVAVVAADVVKGCVPNFSQVGGMVGDGSSC